MEKINEASFVICLETGSWTDMTEEELGKAAGDLSNLLPEELGLKERYAEKLTFLQDVRNRLRLLLVPFRRDGIGKKWSVGIGIRRGVA